MRRPARVVRKWRQHTPEGTLFPFLAVLICTMGSLIVLLVVIARQAQRQASQAAESTRAELGQRLEEDLELAQLMQSQLEEVRRQMQQDLEEERLELGNVESHARQLAKRLARLRDDVAALAAARQNRLEQTEQLRRQLAVVESAIAETEKQLARARQAARQTSTYAIIPYHGPHGTNRRPIYVECRSDSVVIQPEGIVLTEADFAGPLGPGNPLDVALRAVREHLLEKGQLDPSQAGEPYPLFLVRPSGIVAYYAARAALRSWAGQFGYELIEDDWKLAFPPADPQLAEAVRQAIQAARARQQLLLAAAPKHYGSYQSPRPRYRAAPYRGGAVMVPGTEEIRDGPKNPFHRRGDRTPTPVPGEQAVSATDKGPWPHRPPPPKRPQVSHGQKGADRAVSPGASERPGPNGETSSNNPAVASRPSLRPLAEHRGRNWALPRVAAGAVPITRPIRVDCYADRLEIAAEPGVEPARVIPLSQRTEAAIENLVSAVWERIEAWGVAGHGMYWQPVLNVRVAPNAERRFAELQVLLHHSGLKVARKPDRPTAVR